MWPSWLPVWPNDRVTATLATLQKLGPLITGVKVTNESSGITDVWVEKNGQEIKHVQVTGADQTVTAPLLTFVDDDDTIAVSTSWRP